MNFSLFPSLSLYVRKGKAYLQAYSMLDMKVGGLWQRGVSITKSKIVGNEDARLSAIILPEADHVNTSIWPGVSTIT